MSSVKIIGGAMTKIGRHLDCDLKSLVKEAVSAALSEAGIDKSQIQGAWVGLAQNAGGNIGEGEGALSVTILKR